MQLLFQDGRDNLKECFIPIVLYGVPLSWFKSINSIFVNERLAQGLEGSSASSRPCEFCKASTGHSSRLSVSRIQCSAKPVAQGFEEARLLGIRSIETSPYP
jgi:hypothetical protein